MRLLAFSDLHRDLDAAASIVERSGEVDAVIGAGDFASVHEGLEPTIEALAPIECPLILVPGNNETEQALRESAASAPTAQVLHGSGATVNAPGGGDGGGGGGAERLELFGLGAGVPTTPWAWSFDLDEEDAAERLGACPRGLDLMVLHSPPLGHCDMSGQGDHLGSGAIGAAIERVQPRVAVCGHIHESWGAESRIGDTAVFNLGPEGRVLEL